MKKLLALALALALLASFAACGGPKPAPVNAPLILGEKYLLDLDYEQALLYFEQAIKIDPKNPRIQTQIEYIYIIIDDERADPENSDLVRKNPELFPVIPLRPVDEPTRVNWLLALIEALRKLNLRDLALELLERLIAKFPGYEQVVGAYQALAEDLGVAEETSAVTTVTTTTATTTSTRPTTTAKVTTTTKATTKTTTTTKATTTVKPTTTTKAVVAVTPGSVFGVQDMQNFGVTQSSDVYTFTDMLGIPRSDVSPNRSRHGNENGEIYRSTVNFFNPVAQYYTVDFYKNISGHPFPRGLSIGMNAGDAVKLFYDPNRVLERIVTGQVAITAVGEPSVDTSYHYGSYDYVERQYRYIADMYSPNAGFEYSISYQVENSVDHTVPRYCLDLDFNGGKLMRIGIQLYRPLE